ncbi:hypothetical protein Pint_35698 [Pistacia integerrima]|uniref:Uncharacterized protein n=1 Tax=Pistacia integerrima TaxID=434235 RepID=A0ACC0Y2C9_9ROSI|nr:hypothetical protein Pint_35698 [Pistacia integerrima]
MSERTPSVASWYGLTGVLVSGWSVGFFYVGLRVNERDKMTCTTTIFSGSCGMGSARETAIEVGKGETISRVFGWVIIGGIVEGETVGGVVEGETIVEVSGGVGIWETTGKVVGWMTIDGIVERETIVGVVKGEIAGGVARRETIGGVVEGRL